MRTAHTNRYRKEQRLKIQVRHALGLHRAKSLKKVLEKLVVHLVLMCHLGYSSFKGKVAARFNLVVLSYIERQHIGRMVCQSQEQRGDSQRKHIWRWRSPMEDQSNL